MSASLPTLTEIESAAELIRAQVPRTPSYCWPLLSTAAGAEVWVKHENHTPVGAFKVRGGLVYVDELLRAMPEVPGVIAALDGQSRPVDRVVGAAAGLAGGDRGAAG
jgi:threonine dehydratase